MNSVAAIVAFAALATAAHASSVADASSQHCPVQGAVGPTIPWDYSPLSGKGPLEWGKTHAFCLGKQQSPINFPTVVNFGKKSDGPKPDIGKPVMRPIATNMNMGFICPEPGKCGSTTYKGKKYQLANIHFHAPSEHALNGRYYPLESHIVHTGGDGTYAVLSIMFDYPTDSAEEKTKAGQDINDLMRRVLKSVDEEEQEFVIPIDDIVVPQKGYCTYAGSLTTPPCTESVTWLISMHVARISKRQVHHFAVTAGAGYDGNNRPLQSMNNRKVTCYVK